MIINGGQGPAPESPANQIIVKIAPGASESEVASLREELGATLLETTRTMGLELWSVPEGTLGKVLAADHDESVIEYLQPNGLRSIQQTIPDDPEFGQQWSLDNQGQTGGLPDADIDAPEAWDTVTGDGAVVAVIDTGIDYNHPDLDANIWVNPDEIADNGIDDDGNGFVDDVHGYDFVNEDNDPFDDFSHGTHVAGTIAAETNNGIGVAGIAWDAQLMALKCFDSGGFGTDFDIIQAIEYSILEGAHVSNNSYGGGGFSQSLYDAIQAAGEAGQLFVAAAGNDGNDNDAFPSYPASYDLDNIVAVAATNASDELAFFSNYGATSVDLGAPGEFILSTVPGEGYASFDGTSMATPHVVGVAALLLSQEPDLSVEELKALILDTTDPIASLQGFTVSGGRLNAANAVGSNLPPTEITGTEGDDDLAGTAARDIIFALGGSDLVSGLAGSDQLFGGDGGDFISSGGGDDVAEGNAADDVVHGDAGDDTLSGGDGNDVLIGGEGDDAQAGEDGDDDIAGGADNDAIDGDAGNDRLLGEDGNDSILAGDGDDRADGGDGEDQIGGGGGADHLSGGAGNDLVAGEDGDDSVAGGTGDDTVDGGGGIDRIAGIERSATGGWGEGELDVLSGGEGRDTFELGAMGAEYYDDSNATSTGEGDFATISDLDVSTDTIELGGVRGQYLLDFFRSPDGELSADLVFDAGNAARGDRLATLEGVEGGLTLDNSAFVYLGGGDSSGEPIGGGGTDGAESLLLASAFSREAELLPAISPQVPITLPVELTDGGGFRWDVQGDGTISDGTNDAYDGGLSLSGFSFFDSGEAEDDGREIIIGPSGFDGVQVVRKVYVPTDNTWARYLEIVTNTGGAAATFTVGLNTNLGSDGETTVIGTSSGDAFFDVSDQWLVTDDFDAGGDPTMLHVIGGEDALVPTFASISFDDISFGYDLTLAPGETQIVMHFASQNPDQASALTLAPELAELGAGALDGLSPEELVAIVNFSLVEPVPIIGTDGDDVLTGTSAGETIEGRGGDDVIEGLGGRDSLFGQEGDDIVAGGDGNDLVAGGPGDDHLSGEAGNDQLTGEAGHDVLAGGSGDDALDGGEDGDRLLGEDGNDAMLGGGGDDRCLGGKGDDDIEGGAGRDIVVAGAGDDVARGADGNDRVAGGEGNDTLEGGSGTDLLEGGAGDDELDGGSGADRLIGADPAVATLGMGEVDEFFGGDDADVFVLGSVSGVFYDDMDAASTGESDFARILDFDSGVDSVELAGDPDLYRLDFFAPAAGSLHAALIYDTPEARGELVAVVEGASETLSLHDPAFIFV